MPQILPEAGMLARGMCCVKPACESGTEHAGTLALMIAPHTPVARRNRQGLERSFWSSMARADGAVACSAVSSEGQYRAQSVQIDAQKKG